MEGTFGVALRYFQNDSMGGNAAYAFSDLDAIVVVVGNPDDTTVYQKSTALHVRKSTLIMAIVLVFWIRISRNPFGHPAAHPFCGHFSKEGYTIALAQRFLI